VVAIDPCDLPYDPANQPNDAALCSGAMH